MLVWSAFGALALAATTVIRWWLRRVDALGRVRPFPVLSVALLVVVAASLFVPAVRHGRLEDRLADVATSLVGAPVRVECQTAGQEFVDAGAELGYVRYGPDGVPERVTLIKRQQCRHLARYLRSRHENPSRDEVLAVHVLTHEAMHMAGETDEARTECLAVQRDAETARRLGASAEEALEVAQRYWREVYPDMPDRYRSAECRPGGSLDQNGPDAPWHAPQP